jgi:undecaprenyl-phosphate 4-deoxy-4-formamido-L-arabinose transferase
MAAEGSSCNPVTLSFVVPLYNTGSGLPALLDAFRTLVVDGGFELVLVNDASPDGTGERVRAAIAGLPFPVTFVDLARNFGEHAAVLEGFRHTRGEFVINLDDDLQNPLSEALKLFEHLRGHDCEVVYSYYGEKKHHWFRNFGSWLTNAMASLLLDKPKDLYLCSFRGMRRALVDRIIRYTGPYPYVDGLILGATNRIDRILVDHNERADGESGYTMRKLVRLWMNMFFNFSIMPLRLSSVLGASMTVVGLLVILAIFVEHFVFGLPVVGWASLMGAIAVFSGAQLVMLGLIGEYVGRTFMTVSGNPQVVVRSVTQHAITP